MDTDEEETGKTKEGEIFDLTKDEEAVVDLTLVITDSRDNHESGLVIETSTDRTVDDQLQIESVQVV